MAFAYLTDPEKQFMTKSGTINVDGFLKVFDAATDDPVVTYKDFSGTENTESISLDNNGRAVVIADSDRAYRLEVYDRYGTLMWTTTPLWCLPGGGGGAEMTDIVSSDFSIVVDKTSVGSTTTFDLTVAKDGTELLEWIRTSGYTAPDGAMVPTYSEGTMEAGPRGIKLYAGRYYHVTARIVTSVAQMPLYNEFELLFKGIDSEDTSYTFSDDRLIVDCTTELHQNFEVSFDVIPEEDVELYAEASGLASGVSVGLADVQVHRVYSGAPSVPGSVATRTWVEEHYQEILSGGPGIELSGNYIAVDFDTLQGKLTAGTGIIIDSENVISATAAQQVNADWDATSGVQEILNKPDLSQYATTTDLAGKADKVTGATAGDIAVLDATGNLTDTGVSATDLVHDSDYVHTDNNFTDADASKLSGIESGAQANVQADWNQTDTSADDYIKNKPTIPPSSVVDQTYNPSSTNAQSGTAVAGAISGVNQVPSSTSGDSGKVLTVDSQGNPEWADVQAPISAGTGIDITNDTVSVDFTEVQAKLEAGANISITGNVISAIVPEYANADWDATSGEPGYIANKPENLVQDAAYVHTDNNFSDSDKSKLDSIEAGAQANVNSDWDAASGEPGFIENKPDLSQYATQTDLADKQDVLTAGDNITIVNNVISATAAPQLNADWDATSGVQEILHKPDLSQYATQTDLSGKQDVLTAGTNITIVNDVISAASSTQLNADWDATSGVQEILNKPTIPPLKELVAGNGITITDGDDSVTISADAGQQVNADWDATSGVAEILNKPVLAAVATTGAYSDLSGKPTIPTATSDLTNDSGFITLSDVPAQVQPDWDATSGLGEILNKPVLATVATTGAYSDLSGTPAIPTATSDLTNDSGFITLSDVPAQVQPDWDATSGLGEILNKPSIPVIGTITV